MARMKYNTIRNDGRLEPSYKLLGVHNRQEE